METRFGSGPTPSRPWLFGTLTLLFLTGCATSQLAEEGPPPDDQANDQSVDIGYGSVDQEYLSGSVGVVKTDEGQVTGPRTMIEILARVPGVQVKGPNNGTYSVLVRGASPLYVVDGMIVSRGLTSINPNNVESVTVLKNAGETAIYGSRAGHGGVILIKTKTGG